MLLRWLKNIRFHVLAVAIITAVGVYLFISLTVPSGNLQITRLTEIYALLALATLYMTLLISPLYLAFPSLPYRGQALKAQRGLGVSVVLFAVCHVYLAFFKELGGFAGLGFLDRSYLIAISCSASALFILLLMAATSFDYMVRLLGKKWKPLHRLVYLAGVLILIHASILGSHYISLSTSIIAQVTTLAIATLLILEANRFDVSMRKRWNNWPQVGIGLTLVLAMLAFLPHYFLPAGTTVAGFNVHAEHIQLAQQAQQTPLNAYNLTQAQLNSPAFAGLRGDPTRRFTVSFNHPDTIQANHDATLSFQVFDANSGTIQNLFTKVYSQYLHLIIVDDQLEYFSHLHPQVHSDNFSITTQFPHDGVYHLYVDYQPYNAIEQQQAFTVKVGNGLPITASQKPALDPSGTFSGYSVSLTSSAPLKGSELSVGNQTISFTLKDAEGTPVTNLKPYLEAFGHLVMINEATYDYLHVHPNDLSTPRPDQNGGPTVTFLPLGLYGPIKPGIYRIFAQFNPNNTLILADFTITIQWNTLALPFLPSYFCLVTPRLPKLTF